jgi:hypothetical protein
MTDTSMISSSTSAVRRCSTPVSRHLVGRTAARSSSCLKEACFALAKPEVGIGDGPRVIRREVAAWVIARELGFADMVACTVLRDDAPLTGGGQGAASLQVVWPEPVFPDYPGPYSDDDRWRAAIFDGVIAHSDRGGHNWLGVDDAAGQRRLKLVDHGYAFDLQGALSSTFYAEFQGQAIPGQHVAALQRCQALRQGKQLQSLFTNEAGALQNALVRVQRMVQGGTLAI